MTRKEPARLAFLIRLWQVRSEGKMLWRGSLEDAHTGEKRGFGDPAGLFAFLQDKLGYKQGLPKDDESSGRNA